MKTTTIKKAIASILCIITIIGCMFVAIYDVEKCTIYEVSHTDNYCEITVEHDNNLYSANYGLNLLGHFIKKADNSVTVIFCDDEIIAII